MFKFASNDMKGKCPERPDHTRNESPWSRAQLHYPTGPRDDNTKNLTGIITFKSFPAMNTYSDTRVCWKRP